MTRTDLATGPAGVVARPPGPDRAVIAAGAALALAVRLVIVAVTTHRYVPVNDAADFSRIATSIARGHGFGAATFAPVRGASAFRTPLWPGALAAVYAVTGTSLTAGRVLVAVFGAAMAVLVGGVARELLGRRAGVVALALAAVYPPLLLGGYGLNYEPLMGLLVYAALYATVRGTRGRPAGPVAAVGIGVLVGLAVLCRENTSFVLVPICVLIWRAARPLGTRRAWTSALAVLVAAVAVVLPWTIRNAIDLHAFVPVSDSPGYAVAGTYNPYSARHDAAWIPPIYVPAYRSITVKLLAEHADEVTFVDAYERAGVRYAEHHPGYVLEAAGYNTLRLFDLRGPTDSNWLASEIPWPVTFIEVSVVSFYVLAALALAGVTQRGPRRIPGVLWAFPVLWTLSVVFSSAIDQYRFVLEPFVILLASRTIAGWWDAAASRRSAAS